MFATRRGWMARKMRYVGRRSCPDRWFFRRGRVIAVEFKRPGEQPNPSQRREIKRLRDAGIEVYVIDNIEAGRDLFA